MCSEEKSSNMVVSSSSTGGFCYSDLSSSHNPSIQTQPHLVSQIPSYDSGSEIFNLASGMDMIGFPKDSLPNHPTQNHVAAANALLWKGNNFFAKTVSPNNNSQSGPSSSKTVAAAALDDSAASEFYRHEFNKHGFSQADQNLMAAAATTSQDDSASAWQESNKLVVDDSSIRCVFPCEGNERPSQGLSLSLSSANPSSIGLQSFELRHANTSGGGHHSDHHQHPGDMRLFAASTSREGFFGKSNLGSHIQPQQAMMMMHQQAGQFQLRNSKYLGPAQELLNEFCSLGAKQSDLTKHQQSNKSKAWDDQDGDNSGPSGSLKQQSLGSLEFMELQKRKTKLLSMLDEVDRRYRHYCDQMKAVVSSFEAVAGNGAAKVYSALASKAMSRHFRCLRDGIVGQIQATKKAMGEKDLVSPGITRGETPRLKIIDQTLRQQRAFQQMTMMDNHPWRPQRGLPERSVSVLRAWLFEHFLHPYPSDVDKHILARQTGLSRSQVSNWFINARVRLWKPMVEEMYLEETKEHDNMGSSDGAADLEDDGRPNNQNCEITRVEDQKPTSDQLVRIDSECLSSIITSPDKSDQHHHSKMAAARAPQNHHHLHPQNSGFGRVGAAYGGMEIDFSSYNHHPTSAAPYSNDGDASHQNFNGSGGVSLTLGLQQHGGPGHGVSLAFSSVSQNSLFYPRDHIEDCHPVQYSLLDGEGQTLPYRNLMGAQLLHDLAG
ncbi:homeobox protein BEL1 homolog [Syzygium oleosum]|uniref:homeobox protein BEL1 homolog n=1 Tax=Syzygium oleosum TaxID=219896 RepID=UPI0024B993CB|nr:homeobox protein BEL1 homolog [Syzygium oleosum]